MEIWADDKNNKLHKEKSSVLQLKYYPELDTSPLLSPDEANFYMCLIGMTCWLVELGRIDICNEQSMMASYMAAPRQGHLFIGMFHMFGYLTSHKRSHIVFDDSYVEYSASDYL